MSERIFSYLLWYAIAKGVWRGLHKPPPMTTARLNDLLSQLWVEPVRAALSQKALLFGDMMYDTQKED